MEDKKANYESVDDYIRQFPPEVQEKLEALRKVIRESATGATEKISYQMPAFYLHGNLVYFAAFKHHIGFYPTSSGIEAFKDELAGYKGSKRICSVSNRKAAAIRPDKQDSQIQG